MYKDPKYKKWQLIKIFKESKDQIIQIGANSGREHRTVVLLLIFL
jgi:hypothetical protein